MSRMEYDPAVIEAARKFICNCEDDDCPRVPAALTAAFCVLDEDGVPKVLRPWLERWGEVDWWDASGDESTYERVPVFRLRVPYQEEAR